MSAVDAGVAERRVQQTDDVDGVAADVDRYVDRNLQDVARQDARGVGSGAVRVAVPAATPAAPATAATETEERARSFAIRNLEKRSLGVVTNIRAGRPAPRQRVARARVVPPMG